MEQKSALDRLYEESNSLNLENPQYSVEDLLNVGDEEETFLDKMSDKGKETLFSKIEKVELDTTSEIKETPVDTEELEEVSDKDFFGDINNSMEEDEEEKVEVKRGRGRPRKEETVEKTQTQKSSSLDIFMDSLSRDLIDDLRNKDYRIHNLTEEQMSVIFNYLESKI